MTERIGMVLYRDRFSDSGDYRATSAVHCETGSMQMRLVAVQIGDAAARVGHVAGDVRR